jgi:serine protease inhibitor ecotin
MSYKSLIVLMRGALLIGKGMGLNMNNITSLGVYFWHKPSCYLGVSRYVFDNIVSLSENVRRMCSCPEHKTRSPFTCIVISLKHIQSMTKWLNCSELLR